MDGLLTIRETAEFLRISQKSLYNITKSGDLPVIKMNKSVRYSKDDLMLYIKRKTKNGEHLN